MRRNTRLLVVLSCCLISPTICSSKNLLFVKASRNYDMEGQIGEVFRREFEARMFGHSTWRQRFWIGSSNPDFDEAIEIYLRIDGSSWLSYRRSQPGFVGVIADGIDGNQSDMIPQLDRI